jgi:hypothetical protein
VPDHTTPSPCLALTRSSSLLARLCVSPRHHAVRRDWRSLLFLVAGEDEHTFTGVPFDESLPRALSAAEKPARPLARCLLYRGSREPEVEDGRFLFWSLTFVNMALIFIPV